MRRSYIVGRSGLLSGGVVAAVLAFSGMVHGDSLGVAFRAVSMCEHCSTLPYGITDNGIISGAFYDADGVSHGFVIDRNQATPIDVPDSVFVEAGRTNNAGDTVGDSMDGTDFIGRPYVHHRDGTLTLKPGYSGAAYTIGFNITNRGEIYGWYSLDGATGWTGYRMVGDQFVETIRFPGADTDSTFPVGVNNSNEMVGSYITTSGVEHGFYRGRNGAFRTLDFPGATTTEAFDINERGDIVGRYVDSAGINHGFLLRRGLFTTIDYVGPDTYVYGINSTGTMAGYSFTTFPYSPPTSGFSATMR